jgi:hypothetical protein
MEDVEKVENLKIDRALLSNARHCFMTIVNRERIATKQMMIAGRCVFMKTIYIVYMKDYSTDHRNGAFMQRTVHKIVQRFSCVV